jgi:hypothetical protein
MRTIWQTAIRGGTPRVVRESPALATVVADFVVPLLVATAIAAFFAAPWVVLQLYVVAAMVGSVLWLLAFIWRIRVSDERAWRVETYIDAGITGDGVVGRPEPVLIDGAKAAERGRQDRSAAELERMAQFVELAGRGVTSQKAMASYGFDRDEWERRVGILIGLDVASWRKGGKSQGWELTSNVERAIDVYCESQQPHRGNDPRQ